MLIRSPRLICHVGNTYGLCHTSSYTSCLSSLFCLLFLDHHFSSTFFLSFSSSYAYCCLPPPPFHPPFFISLSSSCSFFSSHFSLSFSPPRLCLSPHLRFPPPLLPSFSSFRLHPIRPFFPTSSSPSSFSSLLRRPDNYPLRVQAQSGTSTAALFQELRTLGQAVC